MFCPECGSEYRDGFYECADCQVQLVWELPPEPEKKPIELVTVVRVENPVLLSLVKSILEEAGIPFIVKGIKSDVVFPIGILDAEVLVDRENELEAKSLIGELNERSLDILDDTEE